MTDLTPVDRTPTAVPCANCGGSGMDSTTVVTDPYPIDMPHPCGYCEGPPVDRAPATHAVCCDFNTSLCGLDVTKDVWSSAQYGCPLCDIAAMEHLPCASPTCPNREGWLD